jgi:hypothetical protein
MLSVDASTRRQNPEEHYHPQRLENLKSHTVQTRSQESLYLQISTSNVADCCSYNKSYKKCSNFCPYGSTERAVHIINNRNTRTKIQGVFLIKSYPSSTLYCSSTTSLTAVA